jgi:hypothetical protein
MSSVRLTLLLSLAGCNLVNGPNKNGECRANLQTIIAQEVALYADHQRYSPHPADIGFAPSTGNRYLYLLDAQGEVTRRDALPSPPIRQSIGIGPDTRTRQVTAEWLRARFPPELLPALGVRGQCPNCSMTAGCVGNLDDDDDVDVWTISTDDRIIDAQQVNRGTPFHHLDDRLR